MTLHLAICPHNHLSFLSTAAPDFSAPSTALPNPPLRWGRRKEARGEERERVRTGNESERP